MTVFTGPSPMPRNLPTVDASRLATPPPINDDSKLLPWVANCAEPVSLLVMSVNTLPG